MLGESKVFALSYVAQPQVTFVNDLHHLIQDSHVIDQAIVLSDSPYVIEAATIVGLSAHDLVENASDFSASFHSLLNSEDAFLDEQLDAWFLSFDSTQKLLTTDQVNFVFSKIRHEQSLSVFSGRSDPCARFFKTAAFASDEDFVKSDVQWLNLASNEMYA